MTLHEYMNQPTPQRFRFVELQESEVIRHDTITKGQDKFTSICILGLHERFGVNGLYIQKNNEDRLYTQDEHGNPRALSVFYLDPL